MPLNYPQLCPFRVGLDPDAQVLLIQGPDVRMVNPSGGDRVIFSDPKYAVDQVASCGQGRYSSFESIGRSGGAETNLWRVDSDGTNLVRLTFLASTIECRSVRMTANGCTTLSPLKTISSSAFLLTVARPKQLSRLPPSPTTFLPTQDRRRIRSARIGSHPHSGHLFS